MVGVLEWADKESFASFDKRGRVDAKILKFFQESGIAPDHIVYFRDKEATTPEVKRAFNNFLKKAQKDDQLFSIIADMAITMTTARCVSPITREENGPPRK